MSEDCVLLLEHHWKGMGDYWVSSAQSRNSFYALSVDDLSTVSILLQRVDALLNVDLRHVSPQEDWRGSLIETTHITFCSSSGRSSLMR